MNKTHLMIGQQGIRGPEYMFSKEGTLIFMTGVPLSGKSTLAPLVAASIEGCSLQSMDIIRLVAQMIETFKPENERNPFVQRGSCDSYTLVGDGSYFPESLIEGFNQYAVAVSSVLRDVIPKLEIQGAQDVLFEGVQLAPRNVAEYLCGNNRLVVVTTNAKQVEHNRRKVFGDNDVLVSRYSTDKLLLLQDEIVRQSREITYGRVFKTENVGDYRLAVTAIMEFLLEAGVIESKL